MTTTLTPIEIEVNKYLSLPKSLLADLLSWDRFPKIYRTWDVKCVKMNHDMVQVFTNSGGMIPIAFWQVDQFLEEREYVPVERKVFLVDSIEVVWEDDKGGYTKSDNGVYPFEYKDSCIQHQATEDCHYRAIQETLGQRPGSYQMEF